MATRKEDDDGDEFGFMDGVVVRVFIWKNVNAFVVGIVVNKGEASSQ